MSKNELFWVVLIFLAITESSSRQTVSQPAAASLAVVAVGLMMSVLICLVFLFYSTIIMCAIKRERGEKITLFKRVISKLREYLSLWILNFNIEIYFLFYMPLAKINKKYRLFYLHCNKAGEETKEKITTTILHAYVLHASSRFTAVLLVVFCTCFVSLQIINPVQGHVNVRWSRNHRK